MTSNQNSNVDVVEICPREPFRALLNGSGMGLAREHQIISRRRKGPPGPQWLFMPGNWLDTCNAWINSGLEKIRMCHNLPSPPLPPPFCWILLCSKGVRCFGTGDFVLLAGRQSQSARSSMFCRSSVRYLYLSGRTWRLSLVLWVPPFLGGV